MKNEPLSLKKGQATPLYSTFGQKVRPSAHSHRRPKGLRHLPDHPPLCAKSRLLWNKNYVPDFLKPESKNHATYR